VYRCVLCRCIFADKKTGREHFLSEHPDIVQKWIEKVNVFARENIKKIENWAAGEALFVYSETYDYEAP
jgi:hypothetical protein